MKYLFFLLFILLMNNIIYPQEKKILIVTGGKDFEKESFYSIFDDMEGIDYDTISKPAAYKMFSSELINKYNVIIFYDAYQPISKSEKSNFLNIFELGTGCVFIHHSLVSHQDWDEYENITGGKYYHNPYIHEGKKYGPSTYKHDQVFTIKIIDPDHPVTKGLSDFEIQDEIYLNFQSIDSVNPILASDNCEGGKYIGWTHSYKNSKIVYLQPGHDHHAYENDGFRNLLFNAITWAGK